MGNVYSVGYTRYLANKFVPRNLWGGPFCLDSYEAVALASGEVIYMFTPPKGAKYAGGQLAWDDLGTNNTLAVGIPGDGAKFLAATDAAAAADKIDLDAGATAIDALGYEFDGVTPVIITTAGSQASTGTIKLMLALKDPI